MEVDANECLEILQILDIVNLCEEIGDVESDIEDYFLENSSISDEPFSESDDDTDSDAYMDESDDDPERTEDDMDILQCFINIIELDCILSLASDDTQLKRRKRRWGVHPINQLRKELGHFENLVKEMLMNDHEKFFNYTRMSPAMFDYLLNLVGPKITKFAPNAIPAKFRLLLTLR